MPPMDDAPTEEPPMEEPMGGEEDPFEKEPFDAGVEASEENEPKKFIQQLSGKLGQSLRKYTQDVGMDLELEKFAINSLLSATNTGQMDPEDKQDIIKRVENSGEVEGDEEEMENPEPEMEDPKITGASNPSSAPGGGPEAGAAPMGESIEVLPKEHKQVFKDAKLGVNENQELSNHVDTLIKKYSRKHELVKDLYYYSFMCNQKNVEEDPETVSMILAAHGVGDSVDKYSEVMESDEDPTDEFMSIDDLERVGREISNNVTSHDYIGEDNEEKSLPINNKKDSFVDNAIDGSIERMIDDYLNTANGFDQPEPQVKPKPKTMPETAPVKVPRRSRPFRVRPNINPAPKGNSND